MSSDHQRRIRELAPLIGNTPLLAIEFMFGGQKRTLYAKAENLNMTGSIKDRMAFFILQQGYARGLLKTGDLIAEATSGNTGIAFCAIGRALGHPAVIFMPDWMSAERINLIKSLGAEIVLISKEQGGFLGSIRRSEELAASRSDVFLPRQFSNQDNIEAHYRTTGPEIWWQLRWHSLYPDAFVAGVGTGGTIMGVGRFLREKRPAIRLYPLEPANSPTMSTGHKVGKPQAGRVTDPNEGAHAASGDKIDRNIVVFEDFDDTDVRNAESRTPAQCDPHAGTEDLARQPTQRRRGA